MQIDLLGYFGDAQYGLFDGKRFKDAKPVQQRSGSSLEWFLVEPRPAWHVVSSADDVCSRGSTTCSGVRKVEPPVFHLRATSRTPGGTGHPGTCNVILRQIFQDGTDQLRPGPRASA